jgi:hypothetical protein
VRDLFLRLVFRFLVTERSTEWMFGHRVEWDRPLAGPGPGASATQAA